MKKETLKKYLLNRYAITTIVFLVVVMFFDKYSLIDRWRNAQTINKLEKNIEYYKKEIDKNKQKKHDMQSGELILEKYGREEFYLKKEGEDIYIIEEGNDE